MNKRIKKRLKINYVHRSPQTWLEEMGEKWTSGVIVDKTFETDCHKQGPRANIIPKFGPLLPRNPLFLRFTASHCI